MKKVVSSLLVLMCALLIAGCGSNGGVVVDPNAQAANTCGAIQQPAAPGASAPAQTQNLVFESKGVKIRPYDLAEGVLTSLGAPTKTFEAPSCAYQGVDRFYTYGGFELTVNNIDGADHVSIITIKDDTVSIPQGVKVGDTQDKMIQSMGNNYQECGGIYIFTEDTTTLQIGVTDGKVAQISYMYTPVNNDTQVCPAANGEPVCPTNAN